jgi:ABC-type dipeptide/oligopeptide/nickel transport system permease component
MFLIAVLMIVGITCLTLLGSIGIKNYKKPAFVLTILSIILLSCAVAIFTYGFSQLSNVGLGSLQGSGMLTVLQPGSSEYMNLSASWGLSTGIYLSIIAIVSIIIAVVVERVSNKKKNKDKKLNSLWLKIKRKK